jgi:hypothetical protein
VSDFADGAQIALVGALTGALFTGGVSLLLARSAQRNAVELADGQHDHEVRLEEWRASRRAREQLYPIAGGVARDILGALRYALRTGSREIEGQVEMADLRRVSREVGLFAGSEVVKTWNVLMAAIIAATTAVAKAVNDPDTKNEARARIAEVEPLLTDLNALMRADLSPANPEG